MSIWKTERGMKSCRMGGVVRMLLPVLVLLRCFGTAAAEIGGAGPVHLPVTLLEPLLEIEAEPIVEAEAETISVRNPVHVAVTVPEPIAVTAAEPIVEAKAETIPVRTPVHVPVTLLEPTAAPAEPESTGMPAAAETEEPVIETGTPEETPAAEPAAPEPTGMPETAETEEPVIERNIPEETPAEDSPLGDIFGGYKPEHYSDINAALAAAAVEIKTVTDAERKSALALLKKADDEIFPRKGYTWDFSEAQGYVNELLDGNIIHQYYVYSGKGSDVLMSMLPAETGARTGNKRLNLTGGWEDEFHVSFTLQRTEELPADSGGRCWLQYDNSQTKAAGSTSGVILFPGERAYFFTPVKGETVYTAVGDLSGLDPDEPLTFDVIRMDGMSYFYANGDFLFSYADGINGNVSFSGGSELYQGGNRVHCEFDDFVMTYRD